jgi:transcriptional regulator with XRE-family HTH domain
MKKQAGQDFNELMDESLESPEVNHYLKSFSVLIGDLVLARRVQLAWSQSILAEKAGTIQTRISQIESGDSNVQSNTLDKVLKALGLTGLQPTYINNEEATSREAVLL